MKRIVHAILRTAFFFCAVGLIHVPGNTIEREVKTPRRVPRAETSIVIDGILDDAAWEKALVMGVNNEVRPGYNIPAPVETDMLLLYDVNYFYIGWRAYDPDPSQIVAHLCDHDDMWDDEWVVIGIDTYNDQRGGYEFASNPLGIQSETASGVHGDGVSWDAIWDSAGEIHDWGYSVEMAIPFNAIRFQSVEGDQIWGVDAVRSWPRDVRHHISLYKRNRDDNCYRCQMDKLIGFAGATPGRDIEITPTVSTIGTQTRDDFPHGAFGATDDEYEIGVSGSWGMTPNITLSTAVNPDFSQVEADAFQLDVNRQYALWYEEKRPFFLESSGTFNNFYSRSIATPNWGVKLTGKAGRGAFGVLVSEDDITNLILSGPQYSRSVSLDSKSTAVVLRYGHDIGETSNINLYYNGREGHPYHNRVGGIKADFWPTNSINLDIQAEGSRTEYPGEFPEDYGQPDGEFEDTSYRLGLGRYTSGLDVYVNYSSTADDFRTDLGFMPRVGYTHTEAGTGHTWQRGSGSWWTLLNLGGCYTYEAYQDGTPRIRGYNLWFNYDGPKQADANVYGWIGRHEYAGEDFDTWSIDTDACFWPTGSLFLLMEMDYGETIDYENVQTGRIFSIEPLVEFKLGRGLSALIGHTYERFDIDEGRLYTANLTYVRTVYQFTHRVFIRAIVQHESCDFVPGNYPYDVSSEERTLATQFLFSYKINPQTVFFLGYSDGHFGDHEVELTQYERTLFAKIGYAWVL
jgi:hypothetical protein